MVSKSAKAGVRTLNLPTQRTKRGLDLSNRGQVPKAFDSRHYTPGDGWLSGPPQLRVLIWRQPQVAATSAGLDRITAVETDRAGRIIVVMSSAPEFFMPATSHIDQEAAFTHMANGLDRPVPPIGERVYCVSFESDGTLWKATVGERLKGRKPRIVKGKNVGWEDWWFDDPTLVLAIFPPVPYFVVTWPDVHSHFRDDAFALTPIGIELFSHSSK
jgi:hypothetical protein